MKIHTSLTIDIHTYTQAKATYPNLSQKVEELLKAALQLPNEPKKEENTQKRIHQLQNMIHAQKAQTAQVEKELNTLQTHQANEQKKSTWI